MYFVCRSHKAVEVYFRIFRECCLCDDTDHYRTCDRIYVESNHDLYPAWAFFLICKIKKEAEYDRVYKKVKVPALILTVLLFLGLLVGLLWLVIPRVYESLTDLVNSTEDYINSAEAWIKKYLHRIR